MPRGRRIRRPVLVCKACGQPLKEPYPDAIPNALKRLGMYPERKKDGKKR